MSMPRADRLSSFEALQQSMQAELDAGELFRRASEFGANWLSAAHQRNVAPSSEAIGQLNAFDLPLPAERGNAETILATLHHYGSPAAVAQAGGRFHGLVNGGVVPASLAARLLADCWDQNGVLHAVSPISAQLESITERWLVELLGLPEETVAGFVTGSSMAIVCGLAAARHCLLARQGWDINRQGLNGAPALRLVTSAHTHSAVVKGVGLLGFGTDHIEYVPVDAEGRLKPEQLPRLDSSSILILQAGNVNSGSFDPIAACVDKAREAGAWVHIDGAFGLWAAASRSLAHLCEGLEGAQSFSIDAHKTLNAPYDTGVVLCTEPDALFAALQSGGAYLMKSNHRDSINYVPEMSRRARGIDVWAALAYLGREGVDTLVEGLHLRALQMAEKLRSAGFAILNEVCFNQVLVGLDDPSACERFAQHVQQSGESWVGTSLWFDQPVIRVSVSSWATTEADIDCTVGAFKAAREAVMPAG